MALVCRKSRNKVRCMGGKQLEVSNSGTKNYDFFRETRKKRQQEEQETLRHIKSKRE